VIAAIKATDAETTLGRANWGASPIANVSKHAIFGGQWHWSDAGPQLEIASNVGIDAVTVTRPLELMGA
jgi:branched-chain amino acid transport system substrate-binding protein